MMIVDTKRVPQGRTGDNVSLSKPSVEPTEERDTAVILTDGVPEPEVIAKATRRRFTAQYKLDIINQADNCTEQGSLGTLLRREGLYSSHISTWRRQIKSGTFAALTPKKRGRKEFNRSPLHEDNEKLRKENERLAKRLKQAELIIEVQKIQ